MQFSQAYVFVSIFLLAHVEAVLSAERAEAAQSAAAAPRIETHHPAGWRFTMPRGETARGRAVFEKFQCYDCHRVRGENFPDPTDNAQDNAPELSQMGPLHPPEYFAESIINPSAVAAKKDRGADGKSRMSEEHIKTMTLQELIDVTAYIASLKPPMVASSVSGNGKIIAVVPQNGELIIEHGELKGFMDAMTMGYKVSAPSQLNGLSAGDSVNFTIDTQKRVITKIVKLKK
jgi:Cu/Ag efflux protein CusF